MLIADCCFLSRVREDAFKGIFVDHCGHGFFGAFAQAANNASGALHKHIGIRAQDCGWQDDAEIDDRADGQLGIHVEQDATCRDVGSLGEMLVGIAGTDGNGELERKPYRISLIGQHCIFAHV